MAADMKTLRKALSQMHARACGDTGAVYMSVPARPDVDADLLLSAALDELEALRVLREQRAVEIQIHFDEGRGYAARAEKAEAQRDQLLAAAAYASNALAPVCRTGRVSQGGEQPGNRLDLEWARAYLDAAIAKARGGQ